MSNEWHFVSFEFEPLLFQLDEFCSTTLLFYYDWNLCSGRKLCSSCLRSNYSTSLRLSMAEKGKPEWMSMASVPIHVISWKTWPRNGTVEVKICRGVWGLELMRYCCYLVGTSYFSLSYLSPFLCPKSAQIRLKHSLKCALCLAENFPCPQMMSRLAFLVVHQVSCIHRK